MLVSFTILKIIGAVGGGALLGAGATVYAAKITAKQARKTQFIQATTENRKTWRENIRKEIAEFCQIAYTICGSDTNKCLDKLERLRELEALLQVRMDDPRMACSQQIIRSTHQVVELLSNKGKNQEELFQILEKLKCYARQYLDHSWRITRAEAQTGEPELQQQDCKDCG